MALPYTESPAKKMGLSRLHGPSDSTHSRDVRSRLPPFDSTKNEVRPCSDEFDKINATRRSTLPGWRRRWLSVVGFVQNWLDECSVMPQFDRSRADAAEPSLLAGPSARICGAPNRTIHPHREYTDEDEAKNCPRTQRRRRVYSIRS